MTKNKLLGFTCPYETN